MTGRSRPRHDRAEMRSEYGDLTTTQAGLMLTVATKTISKWIDSGQLAGYRVPGSRHRRVRIKDLVKFAHDHGMPINATRQKNTPGQNS